MQKVNDQILVIGTRVHCILYGGKDGIVFAIHGEQSPETVSQMGGGVIARGGRASFDVVFSNGDISRHVPECIVRGLQWRLLDGIANSEEIAAAITHSALIRAEKEAKAQEAKAAYIARVEHLKTAPEFAHLKQGDDTYSGKLAAANVRAELKKNFSGVKFSVRKSDYGTVRVIWIDGPTVAQVEAIANKYEAGKFNGMDDIYEHNETPFSLVFGGCKYLFTSRETSPELVARAIEKVRTHYGIESAHSVEDFKQGRLYSVHIRNASHNLQSLINIQLSEMPA